MASPRNVSDALIQRLTDWGVRHIYGYSGDGISGLLGALGRAGNKPRLIQPPHAELCALMACAHAKYTGSVGVCLVTQGPGAMQALNGLYDAKLDHQPVLAILGQGSRSASAYHRQDIDLVSLYKDVAHEFVEVLSSPEQTRHLLDRAIRIALSERTVAALVVPQDVQLLDAVAEPQHAHGRASATGHVSPRVLPSEAELERAAQVLNAGKRVAILAGAGALKATNELLAVAERLCAGLAKALLGKASVPDDVPFVTGSIGWLGTRASHDMMKACDTLLMVGTQFSDATFLPTAGQARAVQIDLDARSLGRCYPTEVDLVGDSAETLQALLPRLHMKPDRSFREYVHANVEKSRRELEQTALADATQLNPARVFWELNRVLPDNLMLAADFGSATFWYAQYIQLRRGMQASLSGTLATMGAGIPYALAAKLNHPARPALALVGDGAVQMNGLNALISVAEHWREWEDPRFVVLVLNNRQLSSATWQQRVMGGEPKFAPSQDLFDFPYARYAELVGLEALRVTANEQLVAACQRAFITRRPLLIEAVTDPNVPPLPAEISHKQQDNLRHAISQPDADWPGVFEQLRRSGKLS